MFKDKKIIGAGILLVMTLFILGIVFIKDKPKKLAQEEIEKMFVEVRTNGEDNPKNKEDVANKHSQEQSVLQVNENKNNNNFTSNEDNNKAENQKNLIVVEVRGEIKKPDVYYIEEGKVVNDLINKAGGLTEEADISNINRAKELNNHELVFINNKNNPQEINSEILNNEVKNPSNDSKLQEKKESSKDEKSGSLININKASKEELMTLPSVGEKTAEKIIQYREESSGFKTIEDLKNVDRIGDKTLEKLKDKIAV